MNLSYGMKRLNNSMNGENIYAILLILIASN
jgi:hypothetical protein